jgi:hypothetical protein
MKVDIQERQQIWKDLGGNLTEKAAELANTYDMPSQSAPSKVHDKGKDKAVIKTSSAPLTQAQVEDQLLKEAFGAQHEGPTNAGGAIQPDDNEEHARPEQPADVPQAKYLKPRVDVSGKEPPKTITQKTAQHYALPSLGKYPLDGYDEVEKAAAYFDEWHRRMDPEMRREFCQNMVKRASALSVSVSPLAQRYGSDHWASEEQVKVALDARRSILKASMDPLHGAGTVDTTQADVLNKLAEQRRLMTPDDFAAVLGEFDKVAGLDHHYDGDIPDPYFSCLAKTAGPTPPHAESTTDPDETIIVGNEYLPLRKLVEFSNRGMAILGQRFGEDFSKEFAKDPKGIFDSMPRDQKLVMMRMANTNDSATQGASTA